ncbi:MAG TPA: GNAT family N-acetyltransferase [Candidatus Ornithomonoglobus intestinigallinarum]|uniref:GNAT family N-acetyltransferase n=1 Tax=Candidatus Ornithomonoglobus intestinigallinarum TaxID=2840894 RepID=A0A9D1KPG6_9FIRM|nr:GNAT family N-acetyltransferase [Candidatus Ornithomonoglobus intestinigallinarum]
MEIRRAGSEDIEGIKRLLVQVNNVHADGRPDLFKHDKRKYTDQELKALLADDTRPVFAAVDGTSLLGYAFCVVTDHTPDNNLTDIKTLYIDDLCVDETARGKHIGTSLYGHVKKWAKENGFYNITLNVWSCNKSAEAFYKTLGLVPQKTTLESIL